MSGGEWNYQEYHIRAMGVEVAQLLATVAITEHQIDWAVSNDTSADDARLRVYELWEHVFEGIYGTGGSTCPDWIKLAGCPVASSHVACE